MTARPNLDACAGVLSSVAKRIARNTLRSDRLTTDNLGMRVLGADGAALGTLWSYVGGSKWLSSFFHPSDAADVALDALAVWAYDNTPPYRLRLVDTEVPLLGGNLFGVSTGRAMPTPCCDVPATAQRHGYVVSIVESCRLQGRDPEMFISELLTAS